MMPSKRVTNISNVITHKTIPMSTTQITDAGHDPNADNNLIEGSHLEVLDQLDGAFDFDSDNDNCEMNVRHLDFDSDESSSDTNDDNKIEMNESSMANCQHVKNQLNKRNQRQRKSKLNNKLSVGSESGVYKSYQHSMKNRALNKNIPKYVKLGLFGGTPFADNDPIQQPESTTEQETDGTQNDPNAGTAQEFADTNDDSSADGNNIQQHTDDDSQSDAQKSVNDVTTSDASAEYLNTSADSNAADEFLNREAEQKSHTDQHGPTPSETEAANILTTIKSGDLLRNNDNNKTDNSAINPLSIGNQREENVKILFNNEPVSKTNSGNVAIKTVQKTTATAVNTFSNSNTGDLDALASAALQASSGKLFDFFFYSFSHNKFFLSLIFAGNDRTTINKLNANKNRLNSLGNDSAHDDVSIFSFVFFLHQNYITISTKSNSFE